MRKKPIEPNNKIIRNNKKYGYRIGKMSGPNSDEHVIIIEGFGSYEIPLTYEKLLMCWHDEYFQDFLGSLPFVRASLL